MKLKITFASPGEPEEPNSLLTEARANIIWGEPASSVRSFLISGGMSETDADAKIKDFIAERNTAIRRSAIKNILIGVILIGASAITLYGFSRHGPGDLTYSLRGRGASFGFAMFAGIYGFWKLIKGVIDFARPQSEKESIPDME